MSKSVYDIVAQNIINAGPFAAPLSESVLELVKTIVTEEQAQFLTIFTSSALSLDQIKQKTSLKGDKLEKMLKSLLDGGVLLGLPSKTTGKVNLYRLFPLFPGIFELSFMQGKTSPKEKKLAQLYENIFNEMVPDAQKKYDRTLKFYKSFPALDRVIPVEVEVKASAEKILPVEDVRKLVEKFDDIGVSRCYCRHQKDLIKNPCKVNGPRETCMSFGRFAKYFISHGFARKISKDEAKSILKGAEKAGLVHKTFHDRLNTEMDEMMICSCCKCCCGIFDLYYKGVIPLHSLTSYRSKVDKEACQGCGTCVERCPTEAISLIDEIATVSEDKCIGCGVCTTFCPEEAIKLERTGPREVFVPYKKL